MEVQVLYCIEYKIPISTKLYTIKKYCEDYNLTWERTNITRVYRFYGSNEHNLEMLQYYNNLKRLTEEELIKIK
jgi:hypothetical protein